jgi:serine/threonine protein kinase
MNHNLLAGRYEIQSELGQGASSIVYRARDITLDRTVALKVLSGLLATDPTFTQRFQQEGRLAARLDHPHIVTIYDVGALDDGRAYISMRLLDGSSLAEVIAKRSPLPPAESIYIIRQLANALDYMHRSGLVHRDVKPGNIIIGPENWLTLTDFGIARAMEAVRMTMPGTTLGTPRYMAPEQVKGEEVGAAADSYALGVIAFELLAGHLPFENVGAALMYQIVHDEPPALSPSNNKFSPEVATVLRRGLAKAPADRWPSAGAFAQALESALLGPSAAIGSGAFAPTSGMATHVAPAHGANPQMPVFDQTQLSPPPIYTPPRPESGIPETNIPAQRRRKGGIPLIPVVGGIVVIAGIGTLLMLSGVLTGSTPQTDETAVGLTDAGNQTTGASPLRILSPAEGSGVIGPVTVSVQAPGFQIKSAEQGDVNAYHFHYFIDIDPSSLARGAPIPTGQRGIIHTAEPTFTIDPPLSVGEHTVSVALTKNDHILLTPPIVAKTTFRVLRGLEDARTFEQVPSVFYSNVGSPGRWHIFTVDKPGAVPKQLTNGNSDNVRPSFSPDGTQIVFQSNRGGGRAGLYVMNADGTNLRALNRTDGNPIEADSPTWSPDGSKIAFQANRDGGEQIHVYTVASGEMVQLTRSSNNVSPSWSPDSTRIAFQSDRTGGQQIFVMDVDGRNPAQLTIGQTNSLFPSWSPDGRTIAYSSFEGNTYKLYTMSASGQDVKKLTDGGGDSGDQNPSWSPNGQHLIFASTRTSSENRLYVVEVATGRVQPVTSGRPQDLGPRYPAR